MSDTVIHARWVAPVDGHHHWLDHHAVVMRDGGIHALMPSSQARQDYPRAEHIERPTHLLMPGLVNAHTHAAMNLMRGLANDLPLMSWLENHIWPIESRFLSPPFVADGTDLALAEMIRCGTTCFNDMYFFPEVSAERAARAGMRAAIGMIMIDFPTPWAKSAQQCIAQGMAMREQWLGHDRIHAQFAPHAPYTVSDEPLEHMRDLAEAHDIRIHMHVHETAFEVNQAAAENGQRPLARLDALGLLSPRLLAVHMTQLSEAEIRRCAETGVHVLHSPESNLKLASGLCPVQTLREAGVNVALGTDSSVSNNDLDMIGEMRTAALIGKVAGDNAAAVTAAETLEMATLAGARALGIDDVTGSVEVGKAADLCCVDLGEPETRPVFDPVSALVYSAGRHQVRDTWVAGRPLMLDRQLTTLSMDDLTARSTAWGDTLAAYDASHGE